MTSAYAVYVENTSNQKEVPVSLFAGQKIHPKWHTVKDGCWIGGGTVRYRIYDVVSSTPVTTGLESISNAKEITNNIVGISDYTIDDGELTIPDKPGNYYIVFATIEGAPSGCGIHYANRTNAYSIQIKKPVANGIKVSVTNRDTLPPVDDKNIYQIPYNYTDIKNTVKTVNLKADLTSVSSDYDTLQKCSFTAVPVQKDDKGYIKIGTDGKGVPISGKGDNKKTVTGDYLQVGDKVGERSLNPDLVYPDTALEITAKCSVSSTKGAGTAQYTSAPIYVNRYPADMGNPTLIVNDTSTPRVKYDFSVEGSNTFSILTNTNMARTQWEVCEVTNSNSLNKNIETKHILSFGQTLTVNNKDLGAEQDKSKNQPASGEIRNYQATCYVHRGKWDETSSDAGSVMLQRLAPAVPVRRNMSGSCFVGENKSVTPGHTLDIGVQQRASGDIKNLTMKLLPHDIEKVQSDGFKTISCPTGADGNIVSRSGEECVTTFKVNSKADGTWQVSAPAGILSKQEYMFNMTGAGWDGSADGKNYVLDKRKITVMPQVDVAMASGSLQIAREVGNFQNISNNETFRTGDKFTLRFMTTLTSSITGCLTGSCENNEFSGILDKLNVNLPAQLALQPSMYPEVKINSAAEVAVNKDWDGHDKTKLNIIAAPAVENNVISNQSTVTVDLPVIVTAVPPEILTTTEPDAGNLMHQMHVTGTTAAVVKQPWAQNTSFHFSDALKDAKDVYTFTSRPNVELQKKGTNLLTVKFKTGVRYPVSGSELYLTLPPELERATTPSIAVREGLNFDNAWAGGADKPLITASTLQPDTEYYLTVPVKVKDEASITDKGSVIAMHMGQSKTVGVTSKERVVKKNSIAPAQIQVTIKKTGITSIDILQSDKQQLIKDNKDDFTLFVVARGLEATDNVRLTDNKGKVVDAMTRQSKCSVVEPDKEKPQPACFTATIPIPDNPFTYQLKADVVARDATAKTAQPVILVKPLDNSGSSYPVSFICKKNPQDVGCTLQWGKQGGPLQVPVPYRVGNNKWTSLFSLKQNKIAEDSQSKVINDFLGGKPEEYMLASLSNGQEWDPMQTFNVADTNYPAPALNSDPLTKDIDLTGTGIMPRYGDLNFKIIPGI
ncbi:hypothetical protein ACWKX9_23255 [Enterobacter asburiae]